MSLPAPVRQGGRDAGSLRLLCPCVGGVHHRVGGGGADGDVRVFTSALEPLVLAFITEELHAVGGGAGRGLGLAPYPQPGPGGAGGQVPPRAAGAACRACTSCLWAAVHTGQCGGGCGGPCPPRRRPHPAADRPAGEPVALTAVACSTQGYYS